MSESGWVRGRIVTFYSFKGGVGRTMALANVGFLAALAGRRVLLVDWDLEAPGLAYYFKGLHDPAAAKAIRDAPGILDLVWNWRAKLHAAGKAQDVDELIGSHRQGGPFAACARPLVAGERLGPGGCLDVVGAGRQTVDAELGVSYERALAELSWSAFFEEEAGGALVSAFSEWARQSYDHILVDSRTGLADTAGICTVQVPDTVALCFVLNRQNIDGVAKVGAAIRRNAAHVRLRALPMRVSLQGTGEEADARARARGELSRVAGFSRDEAEKDLSELMVRAAPNVPFFEKLAPFSVEDVSKDVLTLDYLGLAKSLLDEDFPLPSLSGEWREEVRRRLKPTQATVEYAKGLLSASPERAFDELVRLLDGAIELEQEGDEPDPAYLQELLRTAFDFEEEHPLSLFGEGPDLPARAIELARMLAANRPAVWRLPLADCIERFVNLNTNVSVGEDIAMLREIDELLAGTAGGFEQLNRRYVNCRKLARMLVRDDQPRSALVEADKADELAELIEEAEPSKASRTINLGRAEILLIRGDAFQVMANVDAARKAFGQGLETLQAAGPDQLDMISLKHELHARLAASLWDGSENARASAARHAVEAAKTARRGLFQSRHFSELIRAVTADGIDISFPMRFAEIAVGQNRNPRLGSIPLARLAAICSGCVDLCQVLADVGGHDAIALVNALTSMVASVVQNTTTRRRRPEIWGSFASSILQSLRRLADFSDNDLILELMTRLSAEADDDGNRLAEPE